MKLDFHKSILDEEWAYANVERVLKWDERFLNIAKEVASWSKDPSTKVGAVCVNHRHIVSTGYNGFPASVADDERLDNRDTKYKMVIHAEVNAILRADKFFGSLYCWPLPPCSSCASLIIQKQVFEVIAPAHWPERWDESIQLSLELFREANVEVRLYDMSPVNIVIL
jgi:dCMP deaminase